MRLTVLGCAGTYPGPDSGCSSYLVEHDGFTLLLDAGNGATGALQRHCGLFDVDAALISHLHADHCIDLVAYGYARKYAPQGQPPVLPVWGPPGTGDRIRRAFDRLPPGDLRDVYDFREAPAATWQAGPFEITTCRTNHPIHTLGIRLRAGGKSLTYSADTGSCPELVELARGSDLFLCEASWLPGPDPLPPGVHLTAREAGEHAAAAGVDRLVLTHLVPYVDRDRALDEARGVFAATEVATTDASYAV